MTNTTPSGADAMRDAFEKWAQPITALARNGDRYEEVMTSLAWEAWQACATLSAAQEAPQPAAQQWDERQAFEAALTSKPDARFWNTTDAMFWAWQARAELSAAQAAQAQEAAPAADYAQSLHRFLNAAAGEGLELDGVDAAGLYVAAFPQSYARAIANLDSGAEAAPAAQGEPSDTYRLSDFQEGQWWVTELDAMVKDRGTDNQKRAVSVVHHFLRVAQQKGGAE